MEIKELSFLENLSGNDNKTSVMNSVIGGYDDDYSYIYDFLDYFFHPFFEEEVDEVASAEIGVPKFPFE